MRPVGKETEEMVVKAGYMLWFATHWMKSLTVLITNDGVTIARKLELGGRF